MIHLNCSGAKGERMKFSIATTSANTYYPVINFKDMVIVDDTDVNQYHKYVPYLYSNIKGYDNLFDQLEYSRTLHAFDFVSQAINHRINVGKGFITNKENDKILLCLAVNTLDKELLDDEITGNPEYSRFRLFIATEFMVNPIYVNIWKNVKQKFVDIAHQNDVTVEITTSKIIEKSVYSNDFKFEHKSIVELQNHLKNDVTELLLIDFVEEEVIPEHEDVDYQEVPQGVPQVGVDATEFGITMDQEATGVTFATATDSVLTTNDTTSWVSGSDYSVGADSIGISDVPEEPITFNGPVVIGHADLDDASVSTSHVHVDVESPVVEQELSMEEHLDNAAEEQEDELDDLPVLIPFTFTNTNVGGMLLYEDMELLARVLNTLIEAIVIGILYNEQHEITVVYNTGFIQTFTEGSVLDLISTEEGIPEEVEIQVFGSDIEPIIMTSEAGFTWEHYNYGDSLVDINILSQFVMNQYHNGRTVHSLTQRTDNMIEIVFSDNEVIIFTEEEVFNGSIVSPVTDISEQVELIDDTE